MTYFQLLLLIVAVWLCAVGLVFFFRFMFGFAKTWVVSAKMWFTKVKQFFTLARRLTELEQKFASLSQDFGKLIINVQDQTTRSVVWSQKRFNEIQATKQDKLSDDDKFLKDAELSNKISLVATRIARKAIEDYIQNNIGTIAKEVEGVNKGAKVVAKMLEEMQAERSLPGPKPESLRLSDRKVTKSSGDVFKDLNVKPPKRKK